MKVKIEKGVPIPKQQRGTKYPFEKMDIGDSFSLPNTKKNYTSLYTASKRFRETNSEYKFTIRKTNDEIRIWRIKK